MELLVLAAVVALLILGSRRTPQQRSAGAKLAVGAVVVWVLFVIFSAATAAGPLMDAFSATAP